MTGDRDAPSNREAGRMGSSSRGNRDGGPRKRKQSSGKEFEDYRQLLFDSFYEGNFDHDSFMDAIYGDGPRGPSRYLNTGKKKKKKEEAENQRTVSTAPTQSPYQYAITGKIAGPNVKKPGAGGV